jgi:predicted CxxxxCH...CXXCH cytochrome family protein
MAHPSPSAPRTAPLLLLGAVAVALSSGSAGCAADREGRDAGVATGIHAAGILDPDSPDFHGRLLRSLDWSFSLCGSCHGADLSGGAAPSCTTCHTDGPTSCATCHALPPASGAHAAHAGEGPMARRWDCGECHRVPARWDDDGHILSGGRTDPAPAEVAMTGAAAATPQPEARSGAPAYDPATGSCANVFCHGDAMGGGGAAVTEPRWTATGQGQGSCGSCHATPPADHGGAGSSAGSYACAVCHPASAPHIDGAIAVGRAPGCGGCHGSDDSGAPPTDLAGESSTEAVTVGAHQSHLAASHQLRGPLACSDCHAMPAAIDSPGHLDSPAPAEVLPALGWDRGAATCSSAWCHGAATPVWTRIEAGEVGCGTCHGVPPADGLHDPALTLSDCAGCHPATVDGNGNILRSGPPGAETSEHIDGDLDL